MYPEWSLDLSGLTIDIDVVRRLPPAVAFRYLAVPIAEESGRITVLMADPDNQAGVKEVAAALGHCPYLVRANPLLISDLLRTLWPNELPASLRLLVATPSDPALARFLAYSQRLGNLLNSQILYIPISGQGRSLDATDSSEFAPLLRLLHPTPALETTGRLPAALLLARHPRWPIRRLLVLLLGQGGEEAMVTWVLRLARPTGAAVTLLAVTNRESPHLLSWSRPHGEGNGLQQIARQLTQAGIQGELHWRRELGEVQIRQEVTVGDYDLILLFHQPEGVVIGLPFWLERPLLVVAAAS